jgi:endonuclease-3
MFEEVGEELVVIDPSRLKVFDVERSWTSHAINLPTEFSCHPGSVSGMAAALTAKQRAEAIAPLLAEAFPGTAAELCELDFATPFQLLCATVLSAQCTDVRVNATTPALFAAYPDAVAMAGASRAHLEELIFATGFYRAKANHLLELSARLLSHYGGEVPTAREDLVTLAGVGRKTANVVRSVAFSLPGLPVDTHVLRLSRRLDLVRTQDPVKVEHRLNALFGESAGGALSLRLILHGRRTCTARSMACATCILVDYCPTGRKRLASVT